ncbi:MAG: hypothetical protein ABI822_27590, partial [Bryobacteraceae bacterium]
DVVRLIECLPDGCTEFMVHPGILGEELHAAPTRLKQSRADELEALTSPEALAAARAPDVRLVNYRDIK